MTATLSEREHALYRFWNAAGVLLYVGLSVDPGTRWVHHKGEKRWWDEVEQVTIKRYPDRRSVRAAELRAIRTEKPLYNLAQADAAEVEVSPDASVEERFSRSVRRARESRGWSQIDLSVNLRRMAGISLSQTAVARLERAQRPIRFNEAVALSHLLEVALP